MTRYFFDYNEELFKNTLYILFLHSFSIAQCSHVVRQGRGEFHRKACDGMIEMKLSAMKRLTSDQVTGATVHIVPRKRHSERGEMYPDLMGAPRFKVNLQKRQVVFFPTLSGNGKTFHRAPVGDGSNASFAYLALNSVSLHDADRGVNCAVACEKPLTYRVIDLIGVTMQ